MVLDDNLIKMLKNYFIFIFSGAADATSCSWVTEWHWHPWRVLDKLENSNREIKHLAMNVLSVQICFDSCWATCGFLGQNASSPVVASHQWATGCATAVRTVAHLDTCSPSKWKSGHLLTTEFLMTSWIWFCFFLCLPPLRPPALLNHSRMAPSMCLSVAFLQSMFRHTDSVVEMTWII